MTLEAGVVGTKQCCDRPAWLPVCWALRLQCLLSFPYLLPGTGKIQPADLWHRALVWGTEHPLKLVLFGPCLVVQAEHAAESSPGEGGLAEGEVSCPSQHAAVRPDHT